MKISKSEDKKTKLKKLTDLKFIQKNYTNMMKIKNRQHFSPFYLLLFSTFFFFNFKGKKMESDNKENKGLELQYLDTGISPQKDFYSYVNGLWLKNTEIPADKTSWGSFNELQEKNQKKLHNILLEALEKKHLKKNSDEAKAILLYELGMDLEKIETDDARPIAYIFEKIKQLKNKSEVPEILAFLNRKGISTFFESYAYIDDKDTKAMALYLAVSGISLPDRDYYLKDQFLDTRNLYLEHMIKMFVFHGSSANEAKDKAESVLATETFLAKNMYSKVELRDPQLTYNKINFEDLNTTSPYLNLVEYLDINGYKKAFSAIVRQPKYMESLSEFINKNELQTIKDYLDWKTLTELSPYLSKKYREENWNFFNHSLLGSKEMQERWKTVLNVVNNNLGFALGKLYVKTEFSKDAKRAALKMVDNIKLTFKERIQKLDWMSEETKIKALEKLSTFMVKIGYPDVWKSYKELEFKKSESFVTAIIKSNEFEHRENVKSLNKKVDRKKWEMTPQTVNAYYNPPLNEIVFPAAILQAPFFNPESDNAVNYGGIGAVIGHEITHGFDDQGRHYDAEGNLNDWWTESDAKNFKERTQKLVSQFDEFTVLDSLHVNGELTLGENIADLGGATIAHQALLKANKESNSETKIDGFTAEQRFFMSWATVWRIKFRKKALENRILTDVHSPGMIRAFAPLTNLESFINAFDIKKGMPMYRNKENRVKIW